MASDLIYNVYWCFQSPHKLKDVGGQFMALLRYTRQDGWWYGIGFKKNTAVLSNFRNDLYDGRARRHDVASPSWLVSPSYSTHRHDRNIKIVRSNTGSGRWLNAHARRDILASQRTEHDGSCYASATTNTIPSMIPKGPLFMTWSMELRFMRDVTCSMLNRASINLSSTPRIFWCFLPSFQK